MIELALVIYATSFVSVKVRTCELSLSRGPSEIAYRCPALNRNDIDTLILFICRNFDVRSQLYSD